MPEYVLTVHARVERLMLCFTVVTLRSYEFGIVDVPKVDQDSGDAFVACRLVDHVVISDPLRSWLKSLMITDVIFAWDVYQCEEGRDAILVDECEVRPLSPG